MLYAYTKNLQGDITGIVDTDGTILVSYVYDAWGKVTAANVAGNATGSTLIAKNPYLYRGYRYDSETGLYYLNSRYYDPGTGRFINADDAAYLGADGEVLSYNLYAYCLNNPVNLIDKTGYDAETITAVWGTLMWWLSVIDGPLPIGDILYFSGILILGGIALTLDYALPSPAIYYEEQTDKSQEQDSYDVYDKYGYDIDAPTKERVGKQKGNSPRDNKKQNKQIDQLTQGKNNEL